MTHPLKNIYTKVKFIYTKVENIDLYAKTQVLVCDDALFLHAKGSIKQMRLIKEDSSIRRIIVFYIDRLSEMT